jgi:hypothetical protein
MFGKIKEKMHFEFTPEDRNRICRMSEDGSLQAKSVFESIAGHYLKSVLDRSGYSGSFRWIEKTPNHAYYMDLILSYYPEAQFVNIVRNPVAAINSRKNHFPYNRKTPVEELARLWMKSIAAVEDFGQSYPDKIYSLKYEDLVADPEKDMIKVGDFLKINLKPDLLKRYKNGSQQFIQDWETWKNNVTSNTISNRNFDYRKGLSSIEILKIQYILKNRMREYDYEIVNPGLQGLFNVGMKVLPGGLAK